MAFEIQMISFLEDFCFPYHGENRRFMYNSDWEGRLLSSFVPVPRGEFVLPITDNFKYNRQINIQKFVIFSKNSTSKSLINEKNL